MKRRWRVLVVEDNVMLAQHWTEEVAKGLGEVEVVQVFTEREAMYQIAKREVDVVVSGYHFSPQEDRGFERILAALRQTGRHIPVIFMSGYGVSPVDSFAAAKLGAFDFVLLDAQTQRSVLINAVRSALQLCRIPRVFISHSSKDHLFARKLASSLRNRGWQVWYDEWEIKVGDSIVKKIEDGIGSSGYLVVVLSESSVASKWVREEVDAAFVRQLDGENTKILPALIDECRIPPFLKTRRYADFRSSFDAGVEQIVNAVAI